MESTLPARSPCIVPGDFQSADVTVSALPTRTQAGTPASSLFGAAKYGWLIPLGDFAGAAWNRSGRSSTGTSVPSVPLTPGVPIILGPGREVLLRQSSIVTPAGTVSLIFWPARNEDDLDDPYLLAAIAQAFGGGGAASSSAVASIPNRSLPARATVGGGGTGTHTWTIPGFLWATVLADVGNAGIITLGVGAVFRLSPGGAENNYVGDTATGFAFAGTAGDDLDIMEYGRV